MKKRYALLMLPMALTVLSACPGTPATAASVFTPDTLVPPLREFSYEIGFFRLKIDSLPDKIYYTYRQGYLVRETYKRLHFGPYGEQTRKDSTAFGWQEYRALKAFCSERWQGEEYPLTCKHLSPISIWLVWKDPETTLRAGYAPCRAYLIPAVFADLQQFLETFFAPEQRLSFQVSRLIKEEEE